MLVRIVRMEFREEEVPAFLEIFWSSEPKIKAMQGCRGVSIHRDYNLPNVFFTYSHWDSETDLNNYRNSELFGKVWAATKALFAGKPMAFSLTEPLETVLGELS